MGMHILYILWIWVGVCVVCEHAHRFVCVWVCVTLNVCGLAFPAGSAMTKHFFSSELRGQLLDTVQPHTYSNSLIHKSHRLTLGSPRCPDRWEQKPREESRQEEEEVSESWGRKREECCVVLARPTDTWRCAVLIKPEPHFVHSKPLPFNYTSPIPLKWDFDLLSVKASVQLMRFFLL